MVSKSSVVALVCAIVLVSLVARWSDQREPTLRSPVNLFYEGRLEEAGIRLTAQELERAGYSFQMASDIQTVLVESTEETEILAHLVRRGMPTSPFLSLPARPPEAPFALLARPSFSSRAKIVALIEELSPDSSVDVREVETPCPPGYELSIKVSGVDVVEVNVRQETLKRYIYLAIAEGYQPSLVRFEIDDKSLSELDRWVMDSRAAREDDNLPPTYLMSCTIESTSVASWEFRPNPMGLKQYWDLPHIGCGISDSWDEPAFFIVESLATKCGSAEFIGIDAEIYQDTYKWHIAISEPKLRVKEDELRSLLETECDLAPGQYSITFPPER